MKYTPIFAILIFLFGCREHTPVADVEKGYSPNCKFVYLDKYYTDFLSAIKIDYPNRNKIYSEKIKAAIIEDHFSNSEYAELVLENFSERIDDTSRLVNNITDLNVNSDEIEKIISSAYDRCNNLLKNDDVTFYLVPATPNDKKILNMMGGVSGLTAGSKQILLTIDLGTKSWKEILEYTIAHEFNHAYCTKMDPTLIGKWNLLRYLVFEGKADYFAHQLYPKVKVPWTSTLTENEKMNLWNRIKSDLQSEDPTFLQNVMFGSNNYPQWGGYGLGYDIVQRALKNHPNLLKEDWTNLDAEKFLELSDFR